MKKRTESVYYTHPSSLYGLDRLALLLHQPIQPLLSRVGLTEQALKDPEMVVSYAAICKLLEACASEWDCPDLGIRLGQMQNMEFLGPVGLAARLTDTVGEAIHAVQLNLSIHSNAFHCDTEFGNHEGTDHARITYAAKPHAGGGAQMVELSLCRIYQFLAITSGLTKPKILRVSMQHAPLSSSRLGARFFGCKISYNESVNAVYVDRALLSVPTAVRDASISPIVRAYLEQTRQQTESNMVEVTQRLIAQLLATGRCTRDAVAELLHIHPRTLQRRLAQEHTSFGGLLEDYRRIKAFEIVSRGSMPLVQLSLLLGYANQSAFSTAYRRWYGKSPISDRLFSANGD
ncbi:MAG: AraC family transcriptional regulator ligand-binding domain-containing protein [Pseudomonadota bacterium]|jgi:AraC-like DNA-binding protein